MSFWCTWKKLWYLLRSSLGKYSISFILPSYNQVPSLDTIHEAGSSQCKIELASYFVSFTSIFVLIPLQMVSASWKSFDLDNKNPLKRLETLLWFCFSKLHNGSSLKGRFPCRRKSGTMFIPILHQKGFAIRKSWNGRERNSWRFLRNPTWSFVISFFLWERYGICIISISTSIMNGQRQILVIYFCHRFHEVDFAETVTKPRSSNQSHDWKC